VSSSSSSTTEAVQLRGNKFPKCAGLSNPQRATTPKHPLQGTHGTAHFYCPPWRSTTRA
jgi:hypothetical protein